MQACGQPVACAPEATRQHLSRHLSHPHDCPALYLCTFPHLISQKQADDRMWLIFDTVADAAKFFAAAVEFTGKDPQKGIAGTFDGIKKITLDVQSMLNPPDPIVVNVPFGDDQATPATSGAAWAQVTVASGFGSHNRRNVCQDKKSHWIALDGDGMANRPVVMPTCRTVVYTNLPHLSHTHPDSVHLGHRPGS